MSQAERIADAFRSACLAELTALKPGNVHVFADGHRLTTAEFVRSAERARRSGDATQAAIVDHSWTVKPRQLQPTTGLGR